MLTLLEKVLYLKQLPLFRDLGGDELLAIAKKTMERTAKEGEVLFEENTFGDELFIIVKGLIKIYSEKQGKLETIAKLGRNEYFSEMSILDDAPRSASAMAIEDSYLLIIKKDIFKELVYDYPEIALAVIRVFSERLRRVNKK